MGSATVHTVTEPDGTEVREELHPMVIEAQELAVTTTEQHEAGLALVQRLKGGLKAIRELFAEPKRAANAAHKAIVAAEKKLTNPVESAIRAASVKCLDFEQEQRRIADEERRRLEAEEKKRAEEAALKEAEEYIEQGGDQETAEQIIEDAIAEPPPPVDVAPAVANVEGISSRKLPWSCSVVSKMDLIKHVAAHPEYEHLLDVNMPAANQMARALRENFRFPGLRAEQKTTLASR